MEINDANVLNPECRCSFFQHKMISSFIETTEQQVVASPSCEHFYKVTTDSSTRRCWSYKTLEVSEDVRSGYSRSSGLLEKSFKGSKVGAEDPRRSSHRLEERWEPLIGSCRSR